ncbi:acyltransferase [Bremerella sp. JC770]|uniref:acyltransferase n=1 Tax=Bremerella sp. JC770 TaxID=3232137 RepID=UPI0034590C23
MCIRIQIYEDKSMPISKDVELGPGVSIAHPDLVNLYGCQIGEESQIGPFVEIQKKSSVGSRCKIQSHSFICEGVTIEDECFIGHHVCFINDPLPRATNDSGSKQTEEDWTVVPTIVKRGASIGSGAVILCGLTIGERAMIGAGAVVTHDVPSDTVVAGVPARLIKSSRSVESESSDGNQ